MSTYFTDKSLKFLRALARHNERAWFQAHKADYEAHVREPFQRLLGDLQVPLARVSTHFRSDPAKVGGSLFRIHRDTRFSNDKTPYKTWQGARLFHERHRQVPAPSFYLHLQPGQSFVGAGLWHPEPPVQQQIRQFIFDNPLPNAARVELVRDVDAGDGDKAGSWKLARWGEKSNEPEAE